MELKLNQLYQQIAEILNQFIPEQWTNVVLYAEFFQEASTVQFYYYPIKNSRPIFCTRLWSESILDNKVYEFYDNLLYNSFRQLRQTFIDHDQEPWTNLTMRFDATGKFSIEYHYDDFTDISPYTTLMMWKHMIAQVPLHDSTEINRVNEYVDYLHKKNWLYNNRPVERIKIE